MSGSRKRTRPLVFALPGRLAKPAGGRIVGALWAHCGRIVGRIVVEAAGLWPQPFVLCAGLVNFALAHGIRAMPR